MKSRSILIFIVLLLITSSLGCIENAQFFKDLTPREAFAIIQKNKDNPDFVILDVRTAEEFGGGHIEKAINLDFRHKDFRENLLELDEDNTYLVHCKSGGRSGKAIEIMKEINFKKIYHLPAGILGWEEEGLPQAK